MAMQQTKKLSEPAWDALAEALTTFQWFKRPFETMIRARFTGAPELLARLNFQDTKRSVVGTLIAGLRSNEAKYQHIVIDVLVALVDADPEFPDLARLDDGAPKVAAAQAALERVRAVAAEYSELAKQRERVVRESQERAESDASRRSHSNALSNLLDRFHELRSEPDTQKRGYAFEPFLNDLFEIWDLEPRAAYKLSHEQIDGAFTFRTDDYLLEARWWKAALGPKELNDFRAKVDSKARNTLGLCIAVEGFTEGAVINLSQSGTPLILMDGADLMPILEGRIDLAEVLQRKRRHAAETGNPMYRCT